MKNMRRVVALIAMLAVLMSSCVFAEEAVVTEIAEPVAAAAVEELPAEEPAAEAPAAEEEAEEAEEEIAEAAVFAVMPAAEEAAEPAANAECEHLVVCVLPGICALCNLPVTGVEVRHLDGITANDPVLYPDNKSMHAYYCPLCEGFAYPEEHFTDCTFDNPNFCAACKTNIPDEYVFHGGLEKVYSVIPEYPEMHGIYCTACQKYLSVGNHSVNCISADTTRCDLCKAAVGANAIEHNYVNDVCTKCGDSRGVESFNYMVPGSTGIGVKEEFDLAVEVKPAGAIHTTSYKSSSTSVATVDANGIVTAKKAGSATITITVTGSDGDSISESFKLTVKKAPTKVSLSSTKLNLYEGAQSQLTANIGGSSYGSTLTWETSDSTVAFVDGSGNVVATGIGEATITVSTFNGKSASCTVNVTGAPVAIEVPADDVNVYYKQKYDLGAKLVDEFGNECAGTLTYESDAPKNVSVDKKGVASVLKSTKGTAYITISGEGLTCEVALNVCAVPSKVSLEEKSIELIRGETYQIEPIIGDDEATVFTYSTAKKAVASVDGNGLVKAEGEGSTTITVKTHNSKSVKLTVNVEDPYKPDSVELSESGTYYLSLGDELVLDAILYPETAESELTWSSSKPKVAAGEITDTGCIISGLTEGTSTITVKTHNGKSATLKVTVVDPYKVAAVELEETGTVDLALGEELELHANILPVTADSDLTWSTSSKTYATVDEFGVVTAKKVGTATITVKSSNGKKDTVKVKVYDPSKPYAVELEETGTVNVNIGEELQLNANVLPATADTKLTWSTSSKTYATVDANGLVTPLKAGTATITVKTSNGLKDTVKVKVTDQYKPTSIELPDIGAVTVGDVVELVPSIEPANAMTRITWKSSNAKIVSVDEYGTLTMLAEGTATITATTHNSKKATLKVTVGKAVQPESIIATVANGKIGVGESVVVNTTLIPSNANTKLTWISNNPTVASVDANGRVTGLKVGTAVITVTTANGKSASVVITVEAESAGIELSSSAGSFSALSAAMGGLKKVEENGKIYYTDASGSGAVRVNYGSQDIKDTVVSVDLVKKSSYRICGVGIGMSVEEAVAALQKSGVTVDYAGLDGIIASSTGNFAIIEIAVDASGKVASVSALVM